MTGLYPVFLDAGYGPDLFWSLSIGEIIDLTESYSRRLTMEKDKRAAALKDEIMILWNQNSQLLNLYSHSNKPDEVELKLPHEYYPELFGEEIQKKIDEERRQKEIELHKARMTDYMITVNQLRKERGESIGRNDS